MQVIVAWIERVKPLVTCLCQGPKGLRWAAPIPPQAKKATIDRPSLHLPLYGSAPSEQKCKSKVLYLESCRQEKKLTLGLWLPWFGQFQPKITSPALIVVSIDRPFLQKSNDTNHWLTHLDRGGAIASKNGTESGLMGFGVERNISSFLSYVIWSSGQPLH